MRAIYLILAAGALLLAACGESATATNENSTPSVVMPVTEAPVSVTPVQAAQPEPAVTVSPTAAPSSLEDAKRLAEGIAREGMAYSLKNAEPNKVGSRPTLEYVWLEGSAFIWQGETIIWINANSHQTERLTFLDGFEATLGDFLLAGIDEAIRLLYERRDAAKFDRVYISYTFKGVPAEGYHWYTKDVLVKAQGRANQEPMLSFYLENRKRELVPWIAGAK